MSLNEDYEKRKEQKERRKVQREKLAGYFYDISKLSFAALVLGIIIPLISNAGDINSWIAAGFGVILTFSSAKLANNILK